MEGRLHLFRLGIAPFRSSLFLIDHFYRRERLTSGQREGKDFGGANSAGCEVAGESVPLLYSKITWTTLYQVQHNSVSLRTNSLMIYIKAQRQKGLPGTVWYIHHKKEEVQQACPSSVPQRITYIHTLQPTEVPCLEPSCVEKVCVSFRR